MVMARVVNIDFDRFGGSLTEAIGSFGIMSIDKT